MILRLLAILGGLIAVIAVSFFVAFISINLVLGCETWDESKWTERNSCLTFSQLMEGVL